MDCRKAGWWLALGMAGGMAGCVEEPAGQTVPLRSPAPLGSAVPMVQDRSKIEKPAALPKKPPKPKTLVALGVFRANEAKAPDLTRRQRQDHREVARKAYQQALEIDPGYIPAYQGLAHLYVDMEDPNHAIETYHRGLEVQPRNPELWLELGMLHGRHHRWDLAVDACQRAVGCDPENRRYVNQLGFTLGRAGRFEESYRCFTTIYTEARAHYKVARMLQHMGYHEIARKQLELALTKDPRLEDARVVLRNMGAGSSVRQVGDVGQPRASGGVRVLHTTP